MIDVLFEFEQETALSKGQGFNLIKAFTFWSN